LRRYRFLPLADAALREIWESVGMRTLHFLGRGPASGYGWFEALLSPTADYWLRYAAVISVLHHAEGQNPGRMIEISSGGWGGMAWALPGRERDICLVDWSVELLGDRRGGKAWRVCADGCRLPFADNSFDTAISLDTLEHLDREARVAFLRELKRIARQTVLVTCPLQSDDGRFRARDFDLKLAQKSLTTGSTLPGWLEEHLLHEHPRPEEIADQLPGAALQGLENCDQWWHYAASSQNRFWWMAAALSYVRSARRSEDKPPYRRGLFHWQKQS